MTLAHTDDPWTSHNAAATLDPARRRLLKDRIIILLDAWGPMTGDEIIARYQDSVQRLPWPGLEDPHNIKRRLSELVRHHGVVRSTGDHRLSSHGKPALVWELAVAVDVARAAVA